MGILKFSTLFQPDYVISKDLIKDEIIAIDAMSEIYRIILGFQNAPSIRNKQSNIEHEEGDAIMPNTTSTTTLWIKTFVDTLLGYKKNNVKTIWVFDGKNIHKQNEIKKRMQKKEEAKEKIQQQIKEINTSEEYKGMDKNTKDQKINELEDKESKASFYVNAEIKQLIIDILISLGIPYVILDNYEGEHVASILNKERSVSAVLSADLDPIIFDATTLYKVTKMSKCLNRKGKKTKAGDIEVYTKAGVLKQLKEKLSVVYENVNYTDKQLYGILLRVCLILGTDFAEKTKSVGPGTVIKKYSEIVLTEDQKNALQIFKNHPKIEDIKIIKFKANPKKFAEILISLKFSEKNIEKYLTGFVVA